MIVALGGFSSVFYMATIKEVTLTDEANRL